MVCIGGGFWSTRCQFLYSKDSPEICQTVLQALRHAGEVLSRPWLNMHLLDSKKTSIDREMDANPAAIFVFGSNLAGRHGKGAALHARQHYGARHGVAYGHMGRSFGIPTKDDTLKSLTLAGIGFHVGYAILDQASMPDYQYWWTQIGCGLAGYEDKDIVGLIDPRLVSSNIHLPTEWLTLLGIAPHRGLHDDT